MTFPDSMFLIEIIVEELNSYIRCKEFYIRIQFTNIFSLNIKDPNEVQLAFTRISKTKKLKKRIQVKNIRTIAETPQDNIKVKKDQSILFTSNINSLISNMKTYPMELYLWSKDNPDDRIGYTTISWSPLHIDYLNKINCNRETTPSAIIGEYNVFNEVTSKRIATIKLNIKLTCFKDRITTQFRSLSENIQNTFIYTGFHSKPAMILSTVKHNPKNVVEYIELKKAIYKMDICQRNQSGSKCILKNINKSEQIPKKIDTLTDKEFRSSYGRPKLTAMEELCDLNKSIGNLLVTDIDKNNKFTVSNYKSCSSISHDGYKMSDYIFGGDSRCFANKVYCVGYFTIENNFNKSEGSSKSLLKGQNSDTSTTDSKVKFDFQIYNNECPNRKADENVCSKNVCSLDFTKQASNLINITKCEQVDCDNRDHSKALPPPDDRILLDISNIKRDHFDISEKFEEIVGEMKAKMNFEGDPCYCSCECTFGFTKKTTYCSVCGGYEKTGEDLDRRQRVDIPFPCPVFHKLMDKNKLKTWSTSGSSAFSKKRADDSQRGLNSRTKSVTLVKRSTTVDKGAESEKDAKKGKKKDDRFKFNYGYQAPQIGHSRCALPCTGTLGAVPKHMGWLWTAENVPGIKFRPMWKPGATNKHVVRLLRIAKNPDEAAAKKKKKDTGKNKKPFKRPLLIVHKKDGEFTVTMETMKSYSKPRAVNHPPFDDKPLLTYTIGRTEEENHQRQRRKERQLRRLERAQRQFIQSAFRDVCREICLKTYEQALGLLPGAEDPNCSCYPANPDETKVNQDVSCSCSEGKSSIGSDTDFDEWILEFTPPNAFYDPTYKGRKVMKTDSSSQYTYLDYRVKLLDRYGNPVPRFFKGPDGKQQCSDLGGFWGPDHEWLEINVDGYVASDDRWAPNSFIGPNGEQVDADTGKFQSTNGKWLIVGIDGYIDAQGKWKFYPKPRGRSLQKKHRVETAKKGIAYDRSGYKHTSEATWSCFGDVTPKQLSKMGIVGHGQDKKLLLSTLKDLLAQGEDVRLPQQSSIPRYQHTKKNRSEGVDGKKLEIYDPRTYFFQRSKCRHPVPSEKGIVAVDTHGNKIYFKLKDFKNERPTERLSDLKQKGISLSAFHVPCFHSFLSREIMKQEQMERLLALSAKNTKCVSTQIC